MSPSLPEFGGIASGTVVSAVGVKALYAAVQ